MNTRQLAKEYRKPNSPIREFENRFGGFPASDALVNWYIWKNNMWSFLTAMLIPAFATIIVFCFFTVPWYISAPIVIFVWLVAISLALRYQKPEEGLPEKTKMFLEVITTMEETLGAKFGRPFGDFDACVWSNFDLLQELLVENLYNLSFLNGKPRCSRIRLTILYRIFPDISTKYSEYKVRVDEGALIRLANSRSTT